MAEQRLIDAYELITDIQGTASEVAMTAPYDAEWFTRMHDRQREIIAIIEGQTAVDAVSRGVHDQVRWERDVAIGQLEEHGIPFGGIAPDVVKVVRCKDCKYCMMCYPEKQIGKEATPGWYCKDQKKYRRPDDFCSYGERRTDNG